MVLLIYSRKREKNTEKSRGKFKLKENNFQHTFFIIFYYYLETESNDMLANYEDHVL